MQDCIAVLLLQGKVCLRAKELKEEQNLKFSHTVSSGMQSMVAEMPAAAPAMNLSEFVVSSLPDNLSNCFLYVS